MRELHLTKGRVAIVDDDDYESVRHAKWFDGDGAVHARMGGVLVKLHRLLVSAPPHLLVDHVNGNYLDNRRCNLRLCTKAENSRNRGSGSGRKFHSRFKGVTRSKNTKKLIAQIHFEGRQIHLGMFRTEVEAARAYDEAARKLFGEFAKVNFPDQPPSVVPIRTLNPEEIKRRSRGPSMRDNLKGNCRVDPESGCWIWLRAKLPTGYGCVRPSGRRRSGYAHRLSYEQFVGPIPPGFEIHHKCSNRSCINPDHLEALTHFENNQRRFAAENDSRSTAAAREGYAIGSCSESS